MSQVVGSNNSCKPITNTAWVRARLCKLQKGCTRLAAASDKVYQLLAHGRWFSPGTPASSTTKTGRHDIAEILLKVALKHQKSISQSNMLSRALLEWLYWRCSNRPLKKPTMCRCLETLRKKSFEDTKVVIRSRNSKDRQNNGQQKSTNNDV